MSIEIEDYGEQKIMEAWKELCELYKTLPLDEFMEKHFFRDRCDLDFYKGFPMLFMDDSAAVNFVYFFEVKDATDKFKRGDGFKSSRLMPHSGSMSAFMNYIMIFLQYTKGYIFNDPYCGMVTLHDFKSIGLHPTKKDIEDILYSLDDIIEMYKDDTPFTKETLFILNISKEYWKTQIEKLD